MRIQTNGEMTADTFVFASFVPVKAEDMKIKSFKNKDTGVVDTKFAPDGRPLYTCPLQLLTLDDEGNVLRAERNVTIAMVTPVDIEPFVHYSLDGLGWFTPYSKPDGSSATTIAIETVKVRGSKPAVAPVASEKPAVKFPSAS